MSARAAWRLEQLGFTEVLDYHAGRKDWESAALPVEGTDAGSPVIADALTLDPPTTTVDATVDAARAGLEGASQSIVVNAHGVVLGVMRKESWDQPGHTLVGDAMRLGPATIRPGDDLVRMATRLTERGVESIIVSDAEGRLIGVLHADRANEVVSGDYETVFRECVSCPGWWQTRPKSA